MVVIWGTKSVSTCTCNFFYLGQYIVTMYQQSWVIICVCRHVILCKWLSCPFCMCHGSDANRCTPCSVMMLFFRPTSTTHCSIHNNNNKTPRQRDFHLLHSPCVLFILHFPIYRWFIFLLCPSVIVLLYMLFLCTVTHRILLSELLMQWFELSSHWKRNVITCLTVITLFISLMVFPGGC